jgi:hypothetical protein
MPFSEMLRRVALVRSDVSDEHVAANGFPTSPNLVTLIMEALRSSEMSVLTRTTLCNITEDGILHSHYRENLKSYIVHKSGYFEKHHNIIHLFLITYGTLQQHRLHRVSKSSTALFRWNR